MKRTILTVFGTRPEVIKMAPVIRELRRREDAFASFVVNTGQHREMCQPYLDLFSIVPDSDLAIMEAGQTPNDIVSNILKAFPNVLTECKPDIVLVQGDTSSALAAALAAYHARTMVGHVEAGLRTGDKYNPFPEEINRRLIGGIADYHFAPTIAARSNLEKEGISPQRIFVTGNTVIDALKDLVSSGRVLADRFPVGIDFQGRRVICVTTHRRESFGAPLRNTLAALKHIAGAYPDVEIVIPVHYNPNVRTAVYSMLEGVPRIHLIEPLSYEQFVYLLNKCYLVLTDSGGIQEEAPSLSKPVLVLRETTERPEGVQAGTARLVGTDTQAIISATSELLDDKAAYGRMANATNPYGDGHAAKYIVDILERDLGHQRGRADKVTDSLRL